MTQELSPYEFVYRGQLAEAALDRSGRISRKVADDISEIRDALSFDLLDPADLDGARRMASVYAAVTAFERSARRFIAKVMVGAHGENWWDNHVSQNIRGRAESRRDEEDKVKWHSTRGDELLTYTELKDLANIIKQNATEFEPYIRSADWASGIFTAIERSRNVIMHSGELAQADIERVGMNIRDWIRQVGA